jgi:methyl-accepting chemotaxis protein
MLKVTKLSEKDIQAVEDFIEITSNYERQFNKIIKFIKKNCIGEKDFIYRLVEDGIVNEFGDIIEYKECSIEHLLNIIKDVMVKKYSF